MRTRPPGSFEVFAPSLDIERGPSPTVLASKAAFEKAGIFAKARPGFVRFSRGDYQLGTGACAAVFPQPIGCFQPVAKTNFAIDIGGVAELYPSKNTIIRFDAGDTIIQFGQRNVAASSTTLTTLVVVPVAAETKHNLQVGVGFGFRFSPKFGEL